MPIELTEQQRQTLDAERSAPLRVVDPRTNEVFVLLPLDQYERVQPLLEEGEFDVREAYPLMDAVAHQEGWDHPDMDSYNDPDPRKPS